MRSFEELTEGKGIDYELAYRAHTGTSFVPEKRAKQRQEDFIRDLRETYDLINTRVSKYGNVAEGEAAFLRFMNGFKKRYESYLSSRVGGMSSMIAGPANFPVRRMQKINDGIHKKLEELIRYGTEVPRKIMYDLLPDDQKPIKAGLSNSLSLLESKLAKLEKNQSDMKRLNSAFKAHKKGQKLDKYKLSDSELKAVLNYDDSDAYSWNKNRMFAAFQLTNNNAEINRLKKRVEAEKQINEKKEEGNKEFEFDGGTVLHNYDVNRIQIFFDDKPDADVRKTLKSNGFRWAPSVNAWQRQLNTFDRYRKERIAPVLPNLKLVEVEIDLLPDDDDDDPEIDYKAVAAAKIAELDKEEAKEQPKNVKIVTPEAKPATTTPKKEAIKSFEELISGLEISSKLARMAHSESSVIPSGQAKATQDEFIDNLKFHYDYINTFSNELPDIKQREEAFIRYAKGYKDRYEKYLRSLIGVTSIQLTKGASASKRIIQSKIEDIYLSLGELIAYYNKSSQVIYSFSMINKNEANEINGSDFREEAKEAISKWMYMDDRQEPTGIMTIYKRQNKEGNLKVATPKPGAMINKAGTIEISTILTDPKRFQNREKLNAKIVKEIAENFDTNQFDELVIWKDQKDGKLYLLAGHHRLEGAKQAGQKEVKYRLFNGNEAQAIRYAKELSNANRTLETPLERASIYRRKLKKSQRVIEVEQDAKKLEGKNWRYIINLANLNPDGKTVNALISLADNSDKNSQQTLEKLADWIGETRRQYADKMTNAHENEAYDFLTDNFASARPAITTKAKFADRVGNVINALDYKKDQPLNLKRIAYKSQGESEYERQMATIDADLKATEAKREELRARFNDPKAKGYVSPDDPSYESMQQLADKQVAKYDAELKVIRKKKLDLMQKKGTMAKGGMAQTNLFAQAMSGIEKEINIARKEQNKPAKPAKVAVKSTLDEIKLEPKEGKISDAERSKNPNLAETYEDAYTGKGAQRLRSLLESAKKDGLKLSEAKVIAIGWAMRPYIQSFRGAVIDVEATNKRVLAPNLNNLMRWTTNPGRYDLVGVDISGSSKPTVLARAVKKAKILNMFGLK